MRAGWSWDDNVQPTDNTYEDGEGLQNGASVAVDKNGKAHIAWHSYRYDSTYRNIDYNTIEPDGSIGAVLGVTESSTYENRRPTIAIDSNNKSHIVWDGERYCYEQSCSPTTYYNIDYNTITDGGTLGWSKDSPLGVTSSTTYHSWNSTIAVDSNNKSHLPFLSSRITASFNNIDYNTVTDGGSVGSLVGVTKSLVDFGNLYPAIAVDTNNKSHIVWHSLRFSSSQYNTSSPPRIAPHAYFPVLLTLGGVYVAFWRGSFHISLPAKRADKAV